MSKNATSCSRVSDGMNCTRCREKKMSKNGTTKNKKQQYYCKNCGKRFIENYTYMAYKSDVDKNIIQFTKDGLGIRSTARILKISTTTLLKRIVSIAKTINLPIISKGKTYEVDEMCTYIRHKRNFIWLVYALEKYSKNVVSLNLGKRTNKNIKLCYRYFKNIRAQKDIYRQTKKLQISD